MKRFAEAMERCNLEEREYEGEMRIASGIAVYDKKTDKGYKDVFRRADHLMYKNKKEMKESEKKHYERNKQI